jgi:hypothetical protein
MDLVTAQIRESTRRLSLRSIPGPDTCFTCQTYRDAAELLALEIKADTGETLVRGPVCARCIADALAIRFAPAHVAQGGSVEDLRM